MSDETTFSSIELRGWRQFDEVSIKLHEKLTVITGANGSGKSTLLSLFSRHFGYSPNFLATPLIDRSGNFTYLTGIFQSITERIGSFIRQDSNNIGRLQYSNGTNSDLSVPNSANVEYNLKFRNQQSVMGIHIHSHQPISRYQTVSNIPAHFTTTNVAFGQYYSEIMGLYSGSYSGYSHIYRMKEAILSMAVFGEGNRRNNGNPELVRALDGFVDVLRKILPETIGFIDLVVRSPEIVIRTRSGEFLIDSASGGLMTLLDYAWRLHMFSLNNKRFVVTMDEPENHLHPSMQRSLMPRLMEAFPQAQFIIATHSPFMVSAVRDCAVYVLRYRGDNDRVVEGFVPETAQQRVFSQMLDTINRASSANEILREVLGVPATTPEWVSKVTDDLVSKYRSKEFGKKTLSDLRSELEKLGFQDQYPSAVARLLEEK